MGNLNAYNRANSAGRQLILCGAVSTYAPDSKLYSVLVGQYGTRYCRKLLTGVDKPLAAGSRVLVGYFPGVDWLIIGELDALPPSTASSPATFEASIARQESELVEPLMAPIGDLPNFAQLDIDGEVEDPSFSGDVSLENRSERVNNRARLKIYSYGSILMRASRLCYDYWHKSDNTIIRQARNLIRIAFGYKETVITSVIDPKGATTRTEELRANTLVRPTTIDKQTVTGYVEATAKVAGPALLGTVVVNRGQRTLYDQHNLAEVDNDTRTVRWQQAVGDKLLSVQAGSFVAENAPHPVTNVQNPQTPDGIAGETNAVVAAGLHARLGDSFDVVVDTAANECVIESLETNQKIVVNDDGITMQRGSQSFRLDDNGLTINATKFKVVADTCETVVSGDYSVNARTINLN
jgi:hypothetical protein